MVRYAITDRKLLRNLAGSAAEALSRHAGHCARAGISWLQLREKDLAESEQIACVRAMKLAVQQAGGGTRILLNGSPELALRAGAGGVHLPGAMLAVISVKPAGLVVSASAHTVEEVVRAREFADLILFGPVFEKRVQGALVMPGTGLALLAEACRAAGRTPVLALGGITEENAAMCTNAGASGIAGIRIFQP